MFLFFTFLVIIAFQMFWKPRPAHAFLEELFAPVISSVIGGLFEKDAPSPPTAADMQTALQKALDPTLLKIAQAMDVDLSKMAMKEVNKQTLVRQRDNLPGIIQTVNNTRKRLSNYSNEQIADFNKAYEIIKKAGVADTAGDPQGFRKKMDAVAAVDPNLELRVHGAFGGEYVKGWNDVVGRMGDYQDYLKYGDIIDKLPVEGINDMTDYEQIKTALKDVDLVGAIEKGTSDASGVPVPTVKMTDEENDLLTKANEMVKNNPNIKTVDEAIAMMKNAVTGSDEQSQKTIDALNGLSSKFANYQQSGDQTDLMNKIKDRTNFKWSGDYLNNMIKSQLDPLSRQLADKSAAINEQYAAKGFGNSTGVITEGLMPLNKEYAGVAGDIINKSNYQAEEMANQIINDAISQGISLTDSIEKNKLGAWANAADTTLAAGNIGLQNNTFKANTAGDIAGLGTTRQALETSAMDVANKLNQQKQNLALTNIGLEAAARAEQRQKEQDKLNNIISIYGSQNQQSANLADAALTGYKNAYADTVAHNTDLATGINNVVTGIFSKPKTQAQPVTGIVNRNAYDSRPVQNTYAARTKNLYNLK